jgi:hypothetical protein
MHAKKLSKQSTRKMIKFNSKKLNLIFPAQTVLIILIICIAMAGNIHAASQLKTYTRFDKTGELGPPSRTIHHPFGVKFTKGRPAQYLYLVPAQLGGAIFTAIGAFVAWPFSATYNSFHHKKDRWDLIPPVPWASQTIGLGGAYLLGSPFWCIEQAFWEFPVWLFSDTPEPEPIIDDNGYHVGTGV